jgi:hypothetical protein
VHRQPDLLDVVGALGPSGRLSCRLNRWQQERDQYGNDRDDDKKLDQGKPTPRS